jgi:hypothetical protein
LPLPVVGSLRAKGDGTPVYGKRRDADCGDARRENASVDDVRSVDGLTAEVAEHFALFDGATNWYTDGDAVKKLSFLFVVALHGVLFAAQTLPSNEEIGKMFVRKPDETNMDVAKRTSFVCLEAQTNASAHSEAEVSWVCYCLLTDLCRMTLKTNYSSLKMDVYDYVQNHWPEAFESSWPTPGLHEIVLPGEGDDEEGAGTNTSTRTIKVSVEYGNRTVSTT